MLFQSGEFVIISPEVLSEDIMVVPGAAIHPKRRRVIIESDDEDELFDPPHGESRTGSKSNI